jgi:hypothetical protein
LPAKYKKQATNKACYEQSLKEAPMGLYDELTCHYPLPDSAVQAEVFQTKSLGRAMDQYAITRDGRLILHEARYETVPEEERPLYGTPEWENRPWLQLLGSMTRVPVGNREIPYHGHLLFYTYLGERPDGETFEYLAKFTDGRVEEIERVHPGDIENVPTIDHQWEANQVLLYAYRTGGAAGKPSAIKITEQITFEVSFDPADREEGFPDDIRFLIREEGPRELRMFAADESSILLTVEQAEQLAAALLKAAEASRKTPR